jgi:hypothetical protein
VELVEARIAQSLGRLVGGDELLPRPAIVHNILITIVAFAFAFAFVFLVAFVVVVFIVIVVAEPPSVVVALLLLLALGCGLLGVCRNKEETTRFMATMMSSQSTISATAQG